MFPIENDRWIAIFGGMHGNHPPTETDDLTTFATRIPGIDAEQLLNTHQWKSGEITHYPFPSNLRHRYEALDRFPDGLIVIGDAIANFNPVYGQGMSVAALESLLLHDRLATNGLTDLEPRFVDKTTEIADTAWRMADGPDFRFPQTTGPKPRGTDIMNQYISRLTRKEHTDGTLRDGYTRMIVMEQSPTTVPHPRAMWRVLTTMR